MVLLTTTPAVIAAIKYHNLGLDQEPDGANRTALAEPQLDDPICHEQIIKVSRRLRAMATGKSSSELESLPSYHLHELLRGSTVYHSAPPPRQAPTAEYEKLMAKLRADQESLAYSKLLHSPDNPNPIPDPREENDEVTYADVNRQVALIFNVIVSIVACAAAVWIAARRWDAPARLALSMLSAIVVGVAEVGVYMAYLRKIDEAKTKEARRAKKETKEVMDTWVIAASKNKTAKLDTIRSRGAK